MTTGQIIFYSGVALLVLTIILTIVFIIMKPKYVPENAVYAGADTGRTQRLRNGYPTEAVTKGRTSAPKSQGERSKETEKLVNGPGTSTEIIDSAEAKDSEKSKVLKTEREKETEILVSLREQKRDS